MSSSALLQQAAFSAAARPAARGRAQRRSVLVCRAQKQDPVQSVGSKLAVAGAAALLLANPMGAALAGEFDLLAEGTPSSYVLDDADVLNRTTEKSLGEELAALEAKTGYRLEVATLRRLEFESDAFAFGDKLVKKWYGGGGDKKGVLLVVTSAKDGALTGGDAFLAAVGDDLIDSIVGDNIPVLTEDEKYNETVISSVRRVAAKLTGAPDPGAPAHKDTTRVRTYKTKAETEQKKPITSTIVLTLLFISVVVPMLQYFGYTNKD